MGTSCLPALAPPRTLRPCLLLTTCNMPLILLAAPGKLCWIIMAKSAG